MDRGTNSSATPNGMKPSISNAPTWIASRNRPHVDMNWWTRVDEGFDTRLPNGVVVDTSPHETERNSITYAPIPAARSRFQFVTPPPRARR